MPPMLILKISFFPLKSFTNNDQLLDDVIARVVLLVDLSGDGGHELASVGLPEGKESISLEMFPSW